MSTYSYRWYGSRSRSRFRKDPLPDVEVASFKSCVLNSRTGLLAFEEGFPDSRAESEFWDFREGRDRCLRRVSASGVVMSLRMLEPRGEPVSRITRRVGGPPPGPPAWGCAAQALRWNVRQESFEASSARPRRASKARPSRPGFLARWKAAFGSSSLLGGVCRVVIMGPPLDAPRQTS